LAHSGAITSGRRKDSTGPLKPNLVLIYRKTNDNLLQLVRLGSHSELGL
jgi:mRNA interferase YafQ